MHVVIMEFERESDLHEAADYLWNKAGVTGELNIKPAGKGVWRMELIAEKAVRQSVLEKLKGRRVE